MICADDSLGKWHAFLVSGAVLPLSSVHNAALDPDAVCQACRYRDPRDGRTKTPKWIGDPSITYFPSSTNIAPTNYSPVMVSARHFPTAFTENLVEDRNEFIVRPMKFGLVPSWHKGGEAKMDYATINCRAETMQEKKTFSVPLNKGKRCVVLAEGFYEWKKTDVKGETKQPYLIYLPENEEYFDGKADGNEKPIKRLLRMAAVFDEWISPENEKTYSYAIATVAASKTFQWLHIRQPAILATDDDVVKWLDSQHVEEGEAVHLLHAVNNLNWHPVTKEIGKVSYKEPDATKPVPLGSTQSGSTKTGTPPKLPEGQTSITSYFNKTVEKKHPVEDDSDGQKPARKIFKTERN